MAVLPGGRPKPSLSVAPIPKVARRVLDLGCGDGQRTLRAIDTSSPSEGAPTLFCGVDIDMGSLRASKAVAPSLQWVRACGEQLPFKPGSFDYVMSGRALPYMDIPSALREVQRVLTPEGELWASLHPPLAVWDHLLRSIRMRCWKDILYRSYILLNGVVLHFTGKLFRFPLKRTRIESGQTQRGMRLALRSAGFTDIVMNQGGTWLVVVARRRQSLA